MCPNKRIYIYIYIYTDTDTHTHTHIYIYIYIEREREMNKISKKTPPFYGIKTKQGIGLNLLSKLGDTSGGRGGEVIGTITNHVILTSLFSTDHVIFEARYPVILEVWPAITLRFPFTPCVFAQHQPFLLFRCSQYQTTSYRRGGSFPTPQGVISAARCTHVPLCL